MGRLLQLVLAVTVVTLSTTSGAQPSFHTFESGQVRPVALTPDAATLVVVNTPDNRIEVFDVAGGLLSPRVSIPVGLEPVAVAARTNDEVWVVNHLSDSVSVVDLAGAGRVVRTLLVGDEPRDIVFAGPGGGRAFITTAHRGQNSPFPRSEYDTSGVGRADVWVFDAAALGGGLGGDPLAIVTLFGDRPRALAVSPDGNTVYAAVFRSGNRTTIVPESLVCNGGESESPCSVNGVTYPGGLPAPNENHAGEPQPEEGLIAKVDRDGGNSGEWQDELGRDWSAAVKFSLPDLDVFAIDASATPPVQTASMSDVGTVLFNMVVNPVSGVVYVSNTDARNEIRFEGPGVYASGANGKTTPGEPASVRGHLAEAQITLIDGANVSRRHLNKHIPYEAVPMPADVSEKSLSTPMGMAITPDGSTLYVAAFGSSAIGVFDTAQLEADTFVPSAASHIPVAGGGPSALVLAGNRLFVHTRFDNSVVTLDRATGQQLQRLPLHNPEPESVVAGRPFLYDARLTSSNGEAACASCHIFGDMDDVAWDLGDPDADVVANGNVPALGLPLRPFHPVKGPMMTQSLRGLANQGSEHWRGDRQGTAEQAFLAFNEAFDALLGRDEGPLLPEQMEAFRDFALQLRYPPNPLTQLDGSLRADELAGEDLFFAEQTTGGVGGPPVLTCNQCHTIDAAQGFFGSSTESITEGVDQDFKIPHFRNLYQKIGMFGFATAPEIEIGDNGFKGAQVRGYGFSHSGRIDTLRRFLSGTVFSLNESEEQQVEAFMLASAGDLAPVVGQQVTLTSANAAAADPRIDLLIALAGAPFTSKILGGLTTHCDLVAVGNVGGVPRGYVRRLGGLFEPDDGGPSLSDAQLRALAATPGQEVTYTAVPPGSGVRIGVDRDQDLLFNGVETGTGLFLSATDTGTDPALFDSDGDGIDDGSEVFAGSDPNDPNDPNSSTTVLPAVGPWARIALVLMLITASSWQRRHPSLRGSAPRSRSKRSEPPARPHQRLTKIQ